MFSLSIALALLAGAQAAPYYNASTEYASGALGGSPHQTFKSSEAKPVIFNFQKFPETRPEGQLFIAPRGADPARKGATIVEWDGELVWDGADFGEAMSFTPTTYQGEPVIALWQGQFFAAGYGNGRALILDRTYSVIANFTVNIENHPEAAVDFHEYVLTENGTALVSSYVTEPANLTAFGGPADGYIMLAYAQEINVASGEVLWTWRSLDHIPPEHSYADPASTGTSPENPWDYFHINSIEKDQHGNYLMSARHTNALYYVGADGTPIWIMGGKNSTLEMGNVTFSYQHDARFHADGKHISLFDNAGTGWVHDKPSSRGMVVAVEDGAVTLVSESLPANQTVSDSQGGFARVNDTWIAGWGQVPVVSEHNDAGEVLWAAQFGAGDVQSYRAHRAHWAGYPKTNPSLAVQNGTTLFVSWNGATQVASWEVLAADSDADGDASQSLVNATRTGFETEIPVDGAHKFFQVRARDADGGLLGASAFVSADGTQGKGPSTTPVSPPAVRSSTAGGKNSAASRVGVSVAVAVVALAVACAF